MKPFRSLVVLKRPQQELWTIMRDRLVEFAGRIADIDEIRQIERVDDADGMVHIVNEWRVSQQVPPMIQSMLKINELTWIDRNRWDTSTCTCSWGIEPSFLQDYITCSGQTTFASAMGGQGTRVTFAGELDLKPGWLNSSDGVEAMMSGLVESTVTAIIPQTLRAVAEAAASFELT